MTATAAKAALTSRRRYSPEKRRDLLLDSAASIVLRDGLAQISMKSIGEEAGVSKSLVYTYFDGITELLSELLDRELSSLRQRQMEAAESAATFEELVRGVTREYLNFIRHRGLIIERLRTEPSLGTIGNPTQYSRETSVNYFTRIAMKHFDLPEHVARPLTDISLGLPAAAGDYLQRSDIDFETLENLTVTMIIATFNAARDDYLARGKPLGVKA